jgi:SAM-dependent methyltransferase
MVFYNKCPNCGFLFSSSFDQWTHDDFSEFVYNEFYPRIDASAQEERPTSNANHIHALFETYKNSISILDYGSGNGNLETKLRERGFSDTSSFDPFYKSNPIGDRKFDLILCYEVLEHTTTPTKTVESIVEKLNKDGVVIFSTETQPDDIDERGLFWWYVSPRAGHISIHSRQSLTLLWANFGYKVASFYSGLHIAYNTAPPFAKQLLGEQ